MKELSEAKIFLCTCYSDAIFVQRIDKDLHIDYFISYRPGAEQRVEDFYVQIPLSKNDSIAKRMKVLLSYSVDEESISFKINFENEYSNDNGVGTKCYELEILKLYNLYSLTLRRTDIESEDENFVWEWCAERDKFEELMEFIKQLEDELDDELYS